MGAILRLAVGKTIQNSVWVLFADTTDMSRTGRFLKFNLFRFSSEAMSYRQPLFSNNRRDDNGFLFEASRL